MLKINILGAEYTIEYLKRDDDPLFKKRIADGYCDQSSRRIVLRTEDEDDDIDNYSVYLKKNIRHEIVHAFLYESGIGGNFFVLIGSLGRRAEFVYQFKMHVFCRR